MAIEVGDTASRSLTLTAEHVATFAELTGDYNPLHFDENFVSQTKFRRLVVQGGLTTGLLHALVAMDLPGPGTVFLINVGGVTPPVGVIMFTVCGILDCRTGAFTRAALPYFAVMIGFLALIAALPAITLFLPGALM